MKSSTVAVAAAGLVTVSAIAHAQGGRWSGPRRPSPSTTSPEEPERTANNTIYGELLGPGLLYSINYDRTFDDLAVRVGFSYVTVTVTVSDAQGERTDSSGSLVTFPLTVSYLGLGSRRHNLEIGGGVTLLGVEAGVRAFGAEPDAEQGVTALLVAPTGIVGYRLQPPDGGFFLHVGFAPMLILDGRDAAFWPAPFLGLGGTF